MSFHIVPVPPAVAAEARATRRDPWGNVDLTPRRADAQLGYPCRICLTDAAVGEELLLFSYSPFAGPAPYRFVGPIYAHANECPAFTWRGEIPELLRRRLLSVRAYDAAAQMRTADVIDGKDLAATADRFLENPEVVEVHVHIARPGCYACRIVRS